MTGQFKADSIFDEDREYSFVLDASSLTVLVDGLETLLGGQVLHPELLTMRWVVDAMSIVQTLIRKCENPDFLSSFEELNASGIFTFDIPHWAVTELEQSTLKQVSEDKNIPLDTLLTQWKALKPCFTIHEGYSFPYKFNWLAEDVDWKDEPYATLQKDIGANSVISDNKADLEDFGATVVPARILAHAKSYARSEKACITIKFSGAFLAQITTYGIYELYKAAPDLWARIPDALKWAILAGGALALIHPTSRKAISSTLKKSGSTIKPIAQTAYQFYQTEKNLADKAKAELENRFS